MRLITIMLLLLMLPNSAQTLGVQLTWNTGNPDSGIAGYRVYYSSVSPEGPFTATAAVEGSSPLDVGFSSSALLTGLPADKPHYFSVTAYNEQQVESSFSGVVCNFWMPALLTPANGTNQVPTEVTLSWSAPNEPQGYSYTLHYGTDPSRLQVLPVGESGRSPGLPPLQTALLLISLVLGGSLLQEKRRWLATTAVAASLLVSCGGSSGSSGNLANEVEESGPSLNATSAKLALAPNTTYYWKVEADNGKVVTESELYSFTTRQ